MDSFEGKAAVVTGGGSGIGRAMALEFAREGANVAIADIEPAAGEAVANEVRALGPKALARSVDVTDRAALKAFADAVRAEFGRCDILCNNAGVFTSVPCQDMSANDWDWVVDVDLMGVVYGVQAFLPLMLASGEGGHIVNTASIAGYLPFPTLGSYNTAKFAVVGLSEQLAYELESHNVGVSVLCPGLVATNIGDAGRNRQARFGGAFRPGAEGQAGIPADLIPLAMPPERVAALVVRAVREKRLHIFTHEEHRAQVEARFERLLEAYAWTDAQHPVVSRG